MIGIKRNHSGRAAESVGGGRTIRTLSAAVALLASLSVSGVAAADVPVAAIRGTRLAVPATVLGISNDYLARAALPQPRPVGFEFSRDLRNLSKHVDALARRGVELSATRTEAVQLRFQSRDLGGILTICYQH